MKPHIIFLIGMFVFSTTLHAAFENKGYGASAIGLSLAGSASSQLKYAPLINPALIINEQSHVLFGYRNFYGIRDLNQLSMDVGFHFLDRSLGLSMNKFGNNLYSETQIGLGSALHLTDNISAGITANLFFLSIKNYGSTTTFGFNVAVAYKLNEQLSVAGIATNINTPKLGNSGDKIPVCGTIAISYLPLKEMEINLDIVKQDYFDFEYRLGTRLKIMKNFELLSGFNNSVNSFSVGLQYSFGKYCISYALEDHPALNLSHALEVGYAF